MKNENKCFTRGDFAKKCNVKEKQMHNYLNGINNPSLDSLISIAKKCGTNVSWLVGESNIKYAYNIEIENLCRGMSQN